MLFWIGDFHTDIRKDDPSLCSYFPLYSKSKKAPKNQGESPTPTDKVAALEEQVKTLEERNQCLTQEVRRLKRENQQKDEEMRVLRRKMEETESIKEVIKFMYYIWHYPWSTI